MDGTELREARKRARLTMQALANRSHMALSTIQKYEAEGVPPGAREDAIRRALAEAQAEADANTIPQGRARPVPRTALEIPLPESLQDAPDDLVQLWQFRVLSEAYAIAVQLGEQRGTRKQG